MTWACSEELRDTALSDFQRGCHSWLLFSMWVWLKSKYFLHWCHTFEIYTHVYIHTRIHTHTHAYIYIYIRSLIRNTSWRAEASIDKGKRSSTFWNYFRESFKSAQKARQLIKTQVRQPAGKPTTFPKHQPEHTVAAGSQSDVVVARYYFPYIYIKLHYYLKHYFCSQK